MRQFNADAVGTGSRDGSKITHRARETRNVNTIALSADYCGIRRAATVRHAILRRIRRHINVSHYGPQICDCRKRRLDGDTAVRGHSDGSVIGDLTTAISIDTKTITAHDQGSRRCGAAISQAAIAVTHEDRGRGIYRTEIDNSAAVSNRYPP